MIDAGEPSARVQIRIQSQIPIGPPVAATRPPAAWDSTKICKYLGVARSSLHG
jgi:hypothetical protein